MALFKKILPSDSLYTLMNLVNEAFTTTENLLNSILTYVDIDNKKIKSVNKIEVFNGTEDTPKPDLIGITTNQTIKSLGDGLFSGKLSSKSLELSNSGAVALAVNSGDIDLGNASSVLDINGSTNFSKRITLNSYSTSFSANVKANYIVNGSTNYYEGTGADKIGYISMLGASAKILNFSGYASGNDALDVRKVKILADESLPTGSLAILTFVVPTGNSTEFIIDKSTLVSPTGSELTKGVVAVNNYCSVILIYMGTAWVPISLTGCTLV